MNDVNTQLQDAVEAYFWRHFDALAPATQFHFANRLAIWKQDPKALEKLQELRPQFAPNNPDQLRAALQACLAEQPSATTASYEQRLLYFQKYPQLYGYHQALFRVRHLEVLYGIDAAAALKGLVPLSEVQNLANALIDDTEALSTLSTMAVNFLYLAQRYVLDDFTFDPALCMDLKDQYDTANPDELRLLIYLLTHCIIGASNYYAEPVPTEHQATYMDMLKYLESVMSDKLQNLSLDTKLEFLVCCQILGYKTALQLPIYEECSASVSPEGTFIVDTHNVFAERRIKRGFTESEHRNVLFILSGSAFNPRR